MKNKIKIDKKTGWLSGVRQAKSLHYAKRQDKNDIDLLVIHCISLPAGEFGTPYVEDLFTGKLDTTLHPEFLSYEGITLSTHVIINRKGELTQFVSFYDEAWHAGFSEFQGRKQCNEFSIGIELEGLDTVPYEDIQYDQLVELIKEIMKVFPKITFDRVVGHCDVAPGRKTDPGMAFDWGRLRWNLSQS